MAALHYLGICAIFRDEGCYLTEWLDFHLAQGVDHFMLYDHGSSDDGRAVLLPYEESGRVTVVDWLHKGWSGAQEPAYQHGLDNFGERFRWLAFIDIDEFLFSPVSPLPTVLADYEDHCGIVVHWQCYGSSGRAEAGDGLVRDRFQNRAKTDWVRNRRVKSIVDPRKTLAPRGPHFFTYVDGQTAVDEAFRHAVPGPASRWQRRLGKLLLPFWPGCPVDPYAATTFSTSGVRAERLRINHYVIKSLAEYREKRTRFGTGKYDRVFFRYHDRNEVFDPILSSQPDRPPAQKPS